MDSTEFARSGLRADDSRARGVLRGPSTLLTPSASARLIGGVTGWHSPALLLVLFVFFPLVVVESVWSADVGVRLYQAKALLDTNQWDIPHPLPRADPDGLHFPIHLSSGTEDPFRYIPLPKHPALVWLTAALYRIGGGLGDNGLSAIVVVQTLSTFAAAIGAARLMARTRPNLAVPTMWFTGLISPLFFDAYLGYAHSLAAALLIWAALLTLQFVNPLPPGTSADGVRLVAATFLIGIACLVRTEASLLGLAAAGALVVASQNRTDRGRWNFAAVSLALTTGAATIADRFFAPSTTGLANPDQAVDAWGGVVGRIEGIQQTLLLPGRHPTDILVLASAGLVIAAGFLVGRRADERPVSELLLILAAVAAAARVTTGEPLLIFGLIMACPLLVVGLVRGLGSSWSSSDGRFCLTAFALYSAAVVATQYRFGGVAEWGGRYFAAGLPLAAVAAVRGFHSAVDGLPAKRVWRLVVLAVAPALILNVGGLLSLRDSRVATAAMVDEIAEAMATIRLRGGNGEDSVVVNLEAGEDDRPVVVTTVPAVGRLSWTEVDNGRWLLVDHDELTATSERLFELGVRRFVLVSFDPETELTDVERRYEADLWEPTAAVPGDVIILSAVDG